MDSDNQISIQDECIIEGVTQTIDMFRDHLNEIEDELNCVTGC